jgi:hypothetical protein
VKDQALRHSILIVAKSWLSRGDAEGIAVHKILMAIYDGAETLDRVFEDKPTRKKK